MNQASVAARENSANTTGEKSPVNAASKSSPPKVPKQCIVSTSSVEESPLYKIMQAKNNANNTLGPRESDDEKVKVRGTAPPPLPPPPLSQDNAFPSPPLSMPRKQELPNVANILLNAFNISKVAPSDSESEHSSYDSNSSRITDEDETEKSTPSNLKSNDVKRSESPDSGHGSGGEESKPTSPLLLKPANLQTKPQAPLVNKESDVNSKVQDPSALPFKERIAKFGEKALRYQKENVALGPRVL